MYAIKDKKSGRLLGFHYSNHFDNVKFNFELSYDINIWTTPMRSIAENAKNSHPKQYDASFETPDNDFDSKQLKVVKLIEYDQTKQ